jgi:hypothetical protein
MDPERETLASDESKKNHLIVVQCLDRIALSIENDIPLTENQKDLLMIVLSEQSKELQHKIVSM